MHEDKLIKEAKKICIEFGGKPEVEETRIYRDLIVLKTVNCDFGKFKLEIDPWFVSHSDEVVSMNPEEFLAKVPESPWQKEIIEKKKQSIHKIIEKRIPLEPIFINIDKRTGKVINHEGRHRMMVLKDLGVKKVPVFIFYK